MVLQNEEIVMWISYARQDAVMRCFLAANKVKRIGIIEKIKLAISYYKTL